MHCHRPADDDAGWSDTRPVDRAVADPPQLLAPEDRGDGLDAARGIVNALWTLVACSLFGASLWLAWRLLATIFGGEGPL